MQSQCIDGKIGNGLSAQRGNSSMPSWRASSMASLGKVVARFRKISCDSNLTPRSASNFIATVNISEPSPLIPMQHLGRCALYTSSWPVDGRTLRRGSWHLHGECLLSSSFPEHCFSREYSAYRNQSDLSILTWFYLGHYSSFRRWLLPFRMHCQILSLVQQQNDYLLF